MLDLNVDAAGEVDFAFQGGKTPTATDSVGSTTTSAAVDELDCNTSLFTLNFSILGKDAIHIDDDVNNEENVDDNVSEELQLFPTAPSSASATAQYWLNLSAAPEFSSGGGVELGIYKTHLPMSSNQVPQPQVKKSRRGPRSRSSQYRGVTFYRRTGRWESHIWDCGKQVYLGGFDTAHAAARAYDRAAIMFRGVDADINFNTSDYEEDMKQMKNFTKEELVHLLRRQSTGFPRGNSKYRGSASLPKCNQWQLLEKKAYEKSIAQRNENEAIPVANLEPSIYTREVNFGRRDAGSGSSLDLNLGISVSSDSSQGNGFAAVKTLQFPSSTMPANQNLQGEPKYHAASWGAIFPGFSTNTKDKSAAVKTSVEAGYSAGTQMWPWKMQSQGVVPLHAVPISPSAASSGFAHAVSPCLSSLLTCKQRPQFPSFQSLP